MRWPTSLVTDRSHPRRSWNIQALNARSDQRRAGGARTVERKDLRLTDAGVERLRAAREGWREAQSRFAALSAKNGASNCALCSARCRDRVAGGVCRQRQSSRRRKASSGRRGMRRGRGELRGHPNALNHLARKSCRAAVYDWPLLTNLTKTSEEAMSTITVEGAIQTAQGGTLAKRRLKQLYAGLAGLVALAAARYGYDCVERRPLHRKHRRRLCRGQCYAHIAACRRLRRADPGGGQRLCPRGAAACPSRRSRFSGGRRPRGCDFAAAAGKSFQSPGERVAAANGHSPGEGGPRRQDGAGGLRQTRRRQVSPACAFERRVATKRGEGVRAG